MAEKKKKEANTEENQETENTEENTEEKPLTYETWLEAQPEETQNLVKDNTTGLRSALSSEREGRKKFEGELKDLSKTLEGDPKQNVDRILATLEKQDVQLGFYEDAVKAGVKDPKMAYKIAAAGEFINKRGVTNFEALKEEYPLLFVAVKTIDSKGGSGGNERQPQGKDMNRMIRGATGRS